MWDRKLYSFESLVFSPHMWTRWFVLSCSEAKIWTVDVNFGSNYKNIAFQIRCLQINDWEAVPFLPPFTFKSCYNNYINTYIHAYTHIYHIIGTSIFNTKQNLTVHDEDSILSQSINCFSTKPKQINIFVPVK